jgi:EAL domain-containing protein (putative c-di-GMP-specific phosphodiesterase class I)
MANSLELKIIAEGVERQEQLELLYSRGCIEVQGNLFSEPATGEDIVKLIKEEPHLLYEPRKKQIYA